LLKKIKLVQKFVLIMVLLAIIPLVIVGLSMININKDALQGTILDLHTHLAESLAEKIDEYIKTTKEYILFTIKSQEIEELTSTKREDMFKSILESNEDFVILSILNSEGNEIQKIYNPSLEIPTRLLNRGDEESFKEARKSFKNGKWGDRIYYSELYYKESDPRLSVAYPLGNDQYLFIIISLKRLWQKIYYATKVEASRVAYIVNEKGQIIGHPEIEKVREDVAHIEIVRDVLLRKFSGSKEFVDENGIKMVGACAPIRNLGWGIIIEQPKDEAYVSAIKMKRSALIWILLSIAMASLVGGVLARGMTRPILRIIKGAQRVAHGDFSKSVDVETHDELSQLADTFNFMTRELKKYIDMQADKIDAIIYSIGDGFVMTDFGGRLMLLNEQARKMLRIKQKTVAEKKLTDYIEEEDIKQNIQDILYARDEHMVKEIDLSFGTYRKFIKASKEIVKTREGVDIGIVIVLHDITLEKELEQMKDDFVHGITHDLRSPMTSIRGFVDVLKDGSTGELNEEQKEFLDIIDRSSSKLLGMINNILDVAKLETGKMELTLRELDFKDIITRVIEIIKPQADSGKIDLSAQYDGSIPFIKGDVPLLERVVTNLVGNALKFTPPGGKVIVSCKDLGEDVEVSISDTGEGIPPEYVDRIFDRFQQSPGEKRARTGTGLGLTISKYVVESHKGKIWVESEMHKGSKFTFQIPKSLRVDEKGEVACIPAG